MNSQDPATLTSEEILGRIRREAEQIEGSSADCTDGLETVFRPCSEDTPPQPVENPDRLLAVGSFLHLPPQWFVRAAYLSLLKREPDPAGLDNYTRQLKSGQVTRIGMLARIARSPEGRNMGVKIKGLKPLFLFTELSRFKTAGQLLQVLAAPFLLPFALPSLLTGPDDSWLDYFRSLEKNIKKNQQEQLGRVQEQVSGLQENKVDKTRHREQLERVQEQVNGLQSGKADRTALHQVRRMALDCERRLRILTGRPTSREPQPGSCAEQTPALEDPGLEALYATFEDEFRGSRGEIRDRLGLYLPLVRQSTGLTGPLPVLDIGCGRGEWLELLGRQGFVARGIDLNTIFVDECREMGLDVEHGEALACLKRHKPNSFSVISGFHLIEHLPLKTLIGLMDEALRVLAPGGLLLFETPNPRQLLVGSGDFYRDPDHNNPIFPDTLAFIGEQRGFVSSGAYFLDTDTQELVPSQEQKFDVLEDYLNVSRDYAWLGYKA